MPWPSGTRKAGNAGCLATWGSITGSESTQRWAGFHLNGSLSCSADEPGETQQLIASTPGAHSAFDVAKSQLSNVVIQHSVGQPATKPTALP